MRTAGLLMLAPALMAAGCSDGCGKRVIERSHSPDGKHSAVLFEANCGATTGFTTQVAVVDPDGEPDAASLVFAADDGYHQAEPGYWGGPAAKLEWLGPHRLRITYAAGARIFQRKDRKAGVDVELRSDIE